MANAAVLTVSELAPRTWAARPAGAAFDTGTVAVTVYGTISPYRSGAVIAEVSNGGTAALGVAVVAGDNPPAQMAGLGDVTGSVGAGSVGLFGPFETMRFGQDDGTFGLKLTPTGETLKGTVRVYALGKA
jgi:hypothetical protein